MKIAYRIYVVICVGIGLYTQYTDPHPNYFLGGFYGLVGSWVGPGLLLEYALGHSHNLMELFGGSLVFWVIAGSVYKAFGSKAKGRGRGRGLTVDTSGHYVLPTLPPGFDWYSNPKPRTTRTTYYEEED